MVSVNDINITAEEIIDEFTKYYEFICKLYLPSSLIIKPPTEGWSSITPEKTQALGKSALVMDIWRHLPYISDNSNGRSRHGSPYAQWADWQRLVDFNDPDGTLTITEGWEPSERPVSADAFGLTCGGRDTPRFILDVKLGVVYWEDCPRGISDIHEVNMVEDDVQDEDNPAPEEEWRTTMMCWPIPYFFEMLKEQYRKLNFFPVAPELVMDVWTVYRREREGMDKAIQETYREHGWPDLEVYDKDKCLAALEKILVGPWEVKHM